MSLELLSLCIVSGLLLAASISDLRTRRVPNALVLYGAVLGLAFNALAPADVGLLPGRDPGVLAALLGGLTGLALFLPLYVLRLMGAGDVKLLAMAGMWLGAQGVAHAALWSLAAGGVLALTVTLAGPRGTLRQVGMNVLRMGRATLVRSCTAGMLVQAPVQTTGRLPYAVAIATGTAFEMVRLLSA
ncbi:A24 family peptidase [Azohydromonas australica]|uniref:A24 family peptidase n=1 Tax=Azohydromonas australica TaxID=364039 RepID=UPI00041E17A3|nr:A24 family peptidase [Azohydromonas australica]